MNDYWKISVILVLLALDITSTPNIYAFSCEKIDMVSLERL